MTSTKRVVINASPLITLCRSQLYVLLPQLFEAVYVPDTVWQEVVNGGKDDAAARIVHTRSEERRVGKECRRLCRSRWSPYH
jgi:predicted nucleic acid-binding protein